MADDLVTIAVVGIRAAFIHPANLIDFSQLDKLTVSIVATIRIDAKDRVWVNGKRKAAKRRDGALVFQNGKMTFTIQGDRRLKNEDYWIDSSTGTKGPIVVK